MVMFMITSIIIITVVVNIMIVSADCDDYIYVFFS